MGRHQRDRTRTPPAGRPQQPTHGECDSGDDLPAELARLPDEIDRAIVAELVTDVRSLKTIVAACEEDRLRERDKEARRYRWRIWRWIGKGVTATVAVGLLGLAVRTLLAVGVSSEAARAQRDMVRDTAARVRALETESAASHAILLYLQERAGRAP